MKNYTLRTSFGEGEVLRLQRLGPDTLGFEDNERLVKAAWGVQRIMRRAYETEFEIRQDLLPLGTISETMFNEDNPEFSRAQLTRMVNHITDKDSVYWISWSNDDEPLSLVKTSPSLNLKERLMRRPANCYINDVAVAYEGLGLAVRTLCPALEAYQPEQIVVADVVEKTKAMDWFTARGLRCNEAVDLEPRVIGDQKRQAKHILVAQKRMEAQPITSVLETLVITP